MIQRHELTATLVKEPGQRARLRVAAGPGWVEGEHGQDLEAQLKAFAADVGGTWKERSRVPAAELVRCTKPRCKGEATVLEGQTPPAQCERCARAKPDAPPVPVALEPIPDAGVVIVLEQTKPAPASFALEQAFRAAPQRSVAAAACVWARALGAERKRDVSTLCAKLVENKRATRGELELLVNSHFAPQRAKATRARGAQGA